MQFQNFRTLYKKYDLSKEKVYGYFGLTHVFQYQINEHETLASLIRKSDLGLEHKMLSMNFLFVDSKMVINSKMLPNFMRTSKINSKIDISADDIKFLYIYGIQDFKRITGEYEKSLIKMNGMDNSYANSNRISTILRLFPVVPFYNMNEKGKPYIQYTIFVRNSDWQNHTKNRLP